MLQKENLRDLLRAVTKDIANDVEFDLDDVQPSVTQAMNVSNEALTVAEQSLMSAQYDRNAFNVIKRQPKKENPSKNMEATA